MEVEGCALPHDRRYDLENDVWLKVDDDPSRATMGLTSLLASFAGKFGRVTYRPVDGPLARGRSVATVESVRFTGAVRLPVEATVLERNPAIVDRPKLLNDSPYAEGWVARVSIARPEEVEGHLETAAEIESRVRERIASQRIRCYPACPDIELYEVGSECSAVVVRLNEEIARGEPNAVILLVSDDPTSPIEMIRWSDRTGHTLIGHRKEESLYHFLIRREADPRPRRR